MIGGLHRIFPAAFIIALGAVGCDGGSSDAEPSGVELSEEDIVLTTEQLAAARLETVVVRLDSIGTPLRVPGTVTIPDTALATLGSLVEGQVGRVSVVVGDRVAAGAELMRLHSHELTDAIRDRQTASAQVAYRRSALERSRTLYEAGAVSREEVERRQAEYDAAEADSRRSDEWVRHLTPSPQGDIVVRAPRSGIVFAVHVRSGTVVTPGAPLVEIGGTEVLWVHGYVPERAAVRLEAGATVRVEFDALADLSVAGRIVRMGELVDPLRRGVEVRVEMESVPAGVRPGMYATLAVPGPEIVPRAVLPAEAVQRIGNAEIVFVQSEEGRYRPHPVRSEPLGDGALAVVGMADGVTVVTRGAYTLRSVLEGIEVE